MSASQVFLDGLPLDIDNNAFSLGAVLRQTGVYFLRILCFCFIPAKVCDIFLLQESSKKLKLTTRRRAAAKIACFVTAEKLRRTPCISLRRRDRRWPWISLTVRMSSWLPTVLQLRGLTSTLSAWLAYITPQTKTRLTFGFNRWGVAQPIDGSRALRRFAC